RRPRAPPATRGWPSCSRRGASLSPRAATASERSPRHDPRTTGTAPACPRGRHGDPSRQLARDPRRSAPLPPPLDGVGHALLRRVGPGDRGRRRARARDPAALPQRPRRRRPRGIPALGRWRAVRRGGRRLWNRWLGGHTFYQEPLYPYVLAAIYGVAGRRVGAVIFVQALFGVAAAGLVYRLTCRLFDPGAALVAGLLAALYGPAVFHESLLLRDGLVSFVGVATLTVLAVALDRPTHRRWLLLAGLLFGVALLLKSSTLLFSAPAGALVVGRRGREWRGGVAPMVAGLLLAVLPLVARNLAVGAPPLAVAASGPHAFLYYNAADYDPFGG